ncbi:MAG: hypothetical protein KGL39_26945 [Patescibacteria group bacterium]|nr:hypothetical protein [Patescibacteria group bacterium]
MALDLPTQLKHAGLPAAVQEYRFLPGRRFAFDWAFPEEKIAVEIEGGFFGKGKACPVCKRRPVAGHGSIERLLSDKEKYNEAALLGWLVLRVIPDDVASGAALTLIERALEARRNHGDVS